MIRTERGKHLREKNIDMLSSSTRKSCGNDGSTTKMTGAFHITVSGSRDDNVDDKLALELSPIGTFTIECYND